MWYRDQQKKEKCILESKGTIRRERRKERENQKLRDGGDKHLKGKSLPQLLQSNLDSMFH